MAAQRESDGNEVNEVETQERIAKAWYLKQYLSQLEKLLIEEQCHTANDSKAFRQLLDLIERDTPKKVLYIDTGLADANCPICHCRIIAGEYFCNRCAQRLDWRKK